MYGCFGPQNNNSRHLWIVWVFWNLPWLHLLARDTYISVNQHVSIWSSSVRPSFPTHSIVCTKPPWPHWTCHNSLWPEATKKTVLRSPAIEVPQKMKREVRSRGGYEAEKSIWSKSCASEVASCIVYPKTSHNCKWFKMDINKCCLKYQKNLFCFRTFLIDISADPSLKGERA